MKKYKLTSETKIHLGKTLYRIKALITFSIVKKGELGGFIEKENNLSQVYGDAWVSGNALVKKTPIVISGLKYPITITDQHMIIGCEIKTFAEWCKIPQSEIQNKHSDGNLWKIWKPILTRIINVTKNRPLKG